VAPAVQADGGSPWPAAGVEVAQDVEGILGHASQVAVGASRVSPLS